VGSGQGRVPVLRRRALRESCRSRARGDRRARSTLVAPAQAEAKLVLGSALRAVGVSARCEPRSTAAGPLTFFVLPKKVSKESRACEDAACGGSFRCSVKPAGVETRTIAPAARHVLRTVDARLPRLALRCSASSKATNYNDSPLTPALSPSGERVNQPPTSRVSSISETDAVPFSSAVPLFFRHFFRTLPPARQQRRAIGAPVIADQVAARATTSPLQMPDIRLQA
jgi:hypothetical protein